MLSKIDEFKGRWQSLARQDNRYLRELKTLATIASIGSSTRIEGATLSNSAVEELIRKIKITQFHSRDEQEVAGYYETLGLILEQFSSIELSISNIKALHNQLLKFSDKDQRHKGNFKQFSNKVVAKYPDGSQQTIFSTTEPLHTPQQMDDMVNWSNQALDTHAYHPIVIAATFAYEFLSIHPFQDGNGRLSRLLTTLLLLRSGYNFVQYVSFENIIERRKTEYYEALMAGQQNRGAPQESVEQWLLFFVSCLLELISKLEEKFERHLQTKGYINERQRELLQHIRQQKLVQKKDLLPAFGGNSARTLVRDLALLVSESLIEKTGRGKTVAYRAIE